MPTPTITEAPAASASTRAASSAVAAVSNRSGRTPSRSSRSVARARPAPRLDRTTTSRAACSALAEGRSSAAGRPRPRRGRCPAASRASAPRVDADEDRVLLAQERLQPPARGSQLLAVGDHDHRPAGDRRCAAGQPDAVQQQVLLAAQELGAVVGEALQLADHARRAAVHLGRRRSSAVERAAARDGPVAGVHGAVVHPDAAGRPDRGEPAGADAVDQHDAGLGEHAGAEVGVAARDHRRRR